MGSLSSRRNGALAAKPQIHRLLGSLIEDVEEPEVEAESLAWHAAVERPRYLAKNPCA